MKEWFTATELTALPGLPATDRAVQLRARREGWQWRTRAGRGGGREYHISALPAPARKALLVKAVEAPASQEVTVAPEPAALKAWQRETMEARAALLAEVDRLSTACGVSQRQAAVVLAEMARQRRLPEHLARVVPAANARGGKTGSRTLSLRSLQRWLRDREQGGVAALAPKAAPGLLERVPPWAPYLMKRWARPSKPSLQVVVEELPAYLPPGMAPPSYDQARRFIKSLAPQERERGRMGRRAMVAMTAYRARDTKDLDPTSVYTADGQTFKAEVENPLSGLPFRPEIISVLDVKTRKCVGWSAGLAESASLVTDALRRAVETHGVPAIWYTDNGPGFDNIRFDDALTGLLARLGTMNMDSLPDRSHSRGIIERFQRVWNEAAKALPTYLGRDMDRDAAKAVFKLTRREIRVAGRSRMVLPWQEFLAWCQGVIDQYNARPHRALPKIIDAETGLRRHMSPNEAWDAALAEGWTPVTVTPEEAADLYRPYELRTTRRGLVEIANQSYFHPDLEPFHGEQVAVGYDIHDARRVWVREVEHTPERIAVGRLIAVAEWDGHKTRYVPVSVEEQAKEQRAAAALRRLETHADKVRAELAGQGTLIEHKPETPMPLDIEAARGERELARIEEASEPRQPRLTSNGRPGFGTDHEWVAWLLAHPDQATATDRQHLRAKLRLQHFRMLLDAAGIDLAAVEAMVRDTVREIDETHLRQDQQRAAVS